MATKTIAWATGTGSITISYGGSGSGTATITTSDNNLYEARSQEITLRTTAGSPQVTKKVTITQAARVRTDISAAVVTAANQTYSGSALTPVPTVTLNGDTVPSTGYDISYSDNTNAGTATITVMGKGDYTGTATGTFTIAQATGQVTTAPTARSVKYSGSAQYLVTAGSGTGTMQYRYKLSTSSTWSSWSTTRARSTNAGTYNVQYRVAASADGNYTVSAVGELNVTMAKASRTIAFTTAPTSVEIGATIIVVATPSAGASDGTITYASSDTSKASVSGNVVTGVALGACTISATISGGSNYNDATTSYSLGVTEKNYANEYFTIESLEDGNEISLARYNGISRGVYWSTDKTSWTLNSSAAATVTLGKGQRLYVKRTGTSMADSTSKYCYFRASKYFVVSGNIMSLINGDDFVGTDLTGSNSYAFVRLFNNNTTLVSAEHLILPNSTSDYCYYYMFRGCTSLSVAPKMPATTLSNACYWATYYDCSSLPIAPQLPATTLVQNCYGYMFYSCSKLSYIQCLATDISASSCTNNWVDGVAATGTFVKSSSMSSWATGASGIPTGWTTINNTDVIQTIEYLGSTGTQYINTGIVAQGNETIEITFRNTKNQSTCFMGCRTNSSSGKCTIGSGSSSTTIYAALGSSANTTLKSFDQQKHTIVLNTKTGKASIDGGQEISVGSYTINSLPIFVFACNQGGTVSLNSALEVYSCSIGSKVFIPVRVGAVGYLCETGTGVLYANSGTSSFTLGADIVG